MPNLPAAFIRLRFPLSAFPHLSSLYTERSSEPRHDAAPTARGCSSQKSKNVKSCWFYSMSNSCYKAIFNGLGNLREFLLSLNDQNEVAER